MVMTTQTVYFTLYQSQLKSMTAWLFYLSVQNSPKRPSASLRDRRNDDVLTIASGTMPTRSFCARWMCVSVSSLPALMPGYSTAQEMDLLPTVLPTPSTSRSTWTTLCQPGSTLKKERERDRKVLWNWQFSNNPWHDFEREVTRSRTMYAENYIFFIFKTIHLTHATP